MEKNKCHKFILYVMDFFQYGVRQLANHFSLVYPTDLKTL